MSEETKHYYDLITSYVTKVAKRLGVLESDIARTVISSGLAEQLCERHPYKKKQAGTPSMRATI